MVLTALGVKDGAPQAIQVADRFHLLMNLGEATKRALQAKGKELKAAFNLSNGIGTDNVGTDPDKPASAPSGKASLDRLHKFERVKELHQKKTPIKQIARITKVQRLTIRKYIQLERLEKKQYASITNRDAFWEVLELRLNKKSVRN